MSTETATKPETNGKPAKAAKKPAAKTEKPAKPQKAAKAVAKPGAFLSLPASELVNLPLKGLTFDRRLQHRKGMTDGDAVAHYAEVDKEEAEAGKPSKLPAIRAIRQLLDEAGNKIEPIYWVYDGFQRGGAFQVNKRKTVPVEVTDGTFEDAFFLSLSSNADNSILPRGKDDARRSVLALIDAPDTLEMVAKKSKHFGGFMRAMARACGVSVGTVDNALADRGLKVSGDKLVKRPARKPDAKPESEPAGDEGVSGSQEGTPTEPAREQTPEEKKAANDAKFAELQQLAYADRVAECQKITKRLGALVATLVTDGANKAAVRGVMKAHKIGLSDEFDSRASEQGTAFAPYYEILELWTPVQKLGAFFADLKTVGQAAKDAAKEGQKEGQKDADKGKAAE